MVSFCDCFKSKRRGRRGEKICRGVAQEEEKPEGERRTSAAAPEEERGAKGNDKEEEEEEEQENEGEKNVEPEGNGGEGDKEDDGEKKVEAPAAEEKPKGGKGKKAKKQGGKKSVEPPPPPPSEAEKTKVDGGKENRTEEEPPLPPEEIELRVSMHCECCARKIRRVLKRYEGVAEVAADWRTQKVVVKGQKAAASPLKLVEHLERETDKKVQLVTPLPPPQPGKKKKKKEEEEEDKNEEIVVASFKLQMHCQACARKIAKKILKMQGVESAEADWEASKVTVRGVFTAEKLAGYVYQKTTKYVVVVVTKDETAAAPEKVEEEDESGGGGGGANLSGHQEKEEEAIDEGEDAEDEMIDKSSGEGKETIGMQATTKEVEEEATLKQCCRSCSAYDIDMRCPPHVCPLCGRGSSDPVPEYPAIVFPHFFSDENPNACSLL